MKRIPVYLSEEELNRILSWEGAYSSYRKEDQLNVSLVMRLEEELATFEEVEHE